MACDVMWWFIEKAETDESIASEADVSIVSSINSSDDIDMLPDAHLAQALTDAGYYWLLLIVIFFIITIVWFLARDSIYAIARYMPSPIRPSVRPSVCPSHGWISQRRLKLGSRNFHHRVAPWL